VLGIVGILDDVTKAVPAHFQRAGDAIVLLWPIPRGEEPDPNLKFPSSLRPSASIVPLPALEREPRARADPMRDATPKPRQESRRIRLVGIRQGVLGGLWGTAARARSRRRSRSAQAAGRARRSKLLRSARDISDGGIAVALAQAAFPKGSAHRRAGSNR
jgi:phosphoribosylformylglycinamidine synthase subunit PurL